jgi:hypothetical protein
MAFLVAESRIYWRTRVKIKIPQKGPANNQAGGSVHDHRPTSPPWTAFE